MITDTISDSPAYILAGDIGGTNTSLALMDHSEGRFHILSRQVYETRKLSNLSEAISQSLELYRKEFGDIEIRSACLSIAGPVVNNACVPTNISWSLNGNQIQEEFGMQTLVINDFTAVCYGVPLLDINDPGELTPLVHPDGSFPATQEYLPGLGVKAVVGAGTGLGVGYLVEDGENILALPAEGGHSDFAPFNDITRKLQIYMEKKNGYSPEPEMFVSGLGLPNIFRFLVEETGADTPVVREILQLEDNEFPPAISKHADEDPTCRRVLELFVEMYARVAHNLALSYLPRKGLFLAGGIAAKNKKFFTENHRFMEVFLKNFQPTIRPVLASIPVYIVEDYKISLFGAAHAFVQLNRFIDA